MSANNSRRDSDPGDGQPTSRDTRLLFAQVFAAGCIGFTLTTLANSPLVFESRLLWFLGHQLPTAIGAFHGGFPSFGADLDDLFVLLTMYVVSTALGLVTIEAVSRVGSRVQ